MSGSKSKEHVSLDALGAWQAASHESRRCVYDNLLDEWAWWKHQRCYGKRRAVASSIALLMSAHGDTIDSWSSYCKDDPDLSKARDEVREMLGDG